MMICRKAQEMFSAYLDGDLMLDDAERLGEHLSVCAGCREELESWTASSAALSAVLDADAVPGTSLEEFVSVCTIQETQDIGRWASFVRWLESPRRAVAATVAGSFALTSTMVILLWFAFGISLAKGNEPPMVPSRYHDVEILADMDRAMKGEWQNGF